MKKEGTSFPNKKQQKIKQKNSQNKSMKEIQKDTIQVGNIKLSIKKMRQIMDYQSIKNVINQMKKDAKSHNQQNLLGKVPSKLLNAIQKQYGQSCFMIRKTEQEQKDITKKNLLMSLTLKRMSHIQLPYLIMLTISGFSINNLQSLSFLQAPKLLYLNLQENNIVNIDILQKADFPNLGRIICFENQIKSIEKLFKINSKKLGSLQLDSRHIKKEHGIEDLRFLAKMPNPMLKRSYLICFDRINQSKSMQNLTFKQAINPIFFINNNQSNRFSKHQNHLFH